MTIIFYHNPMSRGQIVRWMLEETGVPYEVALLDYASDMAGADYLAINPMGKVPAIVHGDAVVTECAAICAYLADAFPAANLAPPITRRADYYRWLFFAAGPIEAAITNKALGVEVSPEHRRMAGYGDFDRTIDALEKMVPRAGWICGEQFTAADVYAGSHIDWGLIFKTLPARPAFEDYTARLRDRPAYQRQKALDGALMEKARKQTQAE